MLAYRACLILIQLKCRLEFGSHPQRSYSRIGSPAGLHDERVCFKDKLRRYTALNGEHRSVGYSSRWDGRTPSVVRDGHKL